MKFFDVDLHVSVVEDVDTQFRALGHTIDIHMMSGHNWVTGRPKASAGTGPGVNGKIGVGSLNMDSWEQFFDDILPSSRNFFLDKSARWSHDNEKLLASYDGYVVTYPPALAMLYEHAPGHTVLNIPIRYEDFRKSNSYISANPAAWSEFNRRLKSMHDAGKLIVVANNLYDKAYFEYFTGLPCRHISSTCDYIDSMAPKWSPRGGKTLLAFGQKTGCQKVGEELSNVKYVRDVLTGQYTHEEIIRSPGIVWIPYNCSIMSFFEHYWLNIPMFVPTQNFLDALRMDKFALQEMTWHQSMLNGSNLPRSIFNTGSLPDPHTLFGILEWMPLYDFYNVEEFPHLIYFDSWTDLADKIANTDLDPISKAMEKQNLVRRERNLKSWMQVLANVKR